MSYPTLIKSKSNSIYRHAQRLTRKKYRDETGMYILEGVKPLEDALSLGVDVKYIIVREGTELPIDFRGNSQYIMDAGLFKKISSTETSQGVIAVIGQSKLHVSALSGDKLERAGNIVVMDRLQDPGNVGTIVRTAEAAGFAAVVVTTGTADIYSPKVVRAAAGSLFRMPIFFGDEDEILHALRVAGKMIVTADLQANVMYDEANLSRDIALVIGNEGSGVSDGFLKASGMRIKIPMEGSIESLNAAVAAGILMYRAHEGYIKS